MATYPTICDVPVSQIISRLITLTILKVCAPKRMCSPGINGEGELKGQLANPGSPGNMAVKTECVYVICSDDYAFMDFAITIVILATLTTSDSHRH